MDVKVIVEEAVDKRQASIALWYIDTYFGHWSWRSWRWVAVLQYRPGLHHVYRSSSRRYVARTVSYSDPATPTLMTSEYIYVVKIQKKRGSFGTKYEQND